jgi:hypothetical protein
MLVGKSTLGDLEPLLDVLEELPDRDGDWRYAMPFFYQTAAQRSQPEVEDDRIDEADRDALPPRILRLYTGKDSNRSEREWIERLAIREPAVVDVTMVIRLAAGSIDTLEQTPIADTYADMERRTGEAYAALPAFHELLERYGDRTNTKIYSLPRCLEMKWLDAYRRENPDHAFEQDLTHCWFGG